MWGPMSNRICVNECESDCMCLGYQKRTISCPYYLYSSNFNGDDNSLLQAISSNCRRKTKYIDTDSQKSFSSDTHHECDH